MTTPDENKRTPSTTWGYRKVKISRGAAGQQKQPAAGRRFFHLPARKPREPLTISVSYRGGAECWYEIHARGSVGRWPGHASLHDVMSEINRAP